MEKQGLINNSSFNVTTDRATRLSIISEVPDVVDESPSSVYGKNFNIGTPESDDGSGSSSSDTSSILSSVSSISEDDLD